MKRWWQTQSARIDALSMRERVFLFLSVLACAVALIDTVWLSPARLAHQQLTQRFDKQSAELKNLREALNTMAKPSTAGQAGIEALTAVKAQLDQVNQGIEQTSGMNRQGTPLAQVLVHLLRRHEGLTLLHTATLAPDASTKATPASAPAGTAAIARQGMELTVSGPYAELTRYVQTLEQALPAVRWGSMQLKSEKQPPELTLQLFLVEVQP
jgi:MSHA biogenesis protein MshJ